MAFTLAEYRKGTTDPRKAAIVDIFSSDEGAPVLQYLPWMEVAGSAIKVTRTKVLPTTAFRAVNAGFVTSEGEIEEITESLKIAGGKITADRAIIAMQGPERLAIAQQGQIQSLARTWNNTFYNGDGTGNSFTGLKTRIAGAQTLAPGAAGALSLGLLDEALAELQGGGTVIMCNTKMYSRFSQAMRNPSIAGNIMLSPNQFGMNVLTYNGVPIVKAGRKADDTETILFDEASSTTSLFLMSMDLANGVCGVQNGEIRPFQPVQQSHANEFDIEWYCNFLVQRPRSALRINKITDVAIIA
jgi:hypothetical protein